MTPRLVLLGPPLLETAGTRHALPPERRTQLLVWLVLRARWIGRAEAAALLWPQQETKLAYTNLRKTLFRMATLPHALPVLQEGGALRVEAASDVAEFEAALQQQRWADAVALGGTPLLQGFDDDANEAWTQWLRFERERLRAAWRDAALRLLAGPIDTGQGIALASRLLDDDPLDEAAMQGLLRGLAQGGQTARAQQAWQQFRQRLADELGVEPGSELVALQAQLAATSASARVGPSETSPLALLVVEGAAADRSFIGRNVELRQIGERLADPECRLLTLLGPGGIGKTRLARRAVAEFGARFTDGVTWLALEDVTRVGQVGLRLAQALSLQLSGTRPMIDQLVAALRAQRRLLVMDNVEQLAALAPQIEPLLAACPGLTVLATSRVRLALAAEHLLPLAGLPCPEPEDADDVEVFDAARLFIQAARRVEPALNPAADAVAIVDICGSVEGLPLALELAAAWTRVLSCSDIAAELRRGVELLRNQDPARPARHASVEAVFEHSWQLLGAAEQRALARLAVFRDGFSAEAARVVAGAVLPVLAALVDKSLLRKEGLRLRMHPLVQQLAAERFDPAQRAAAEAEHARHHLQLLVQLAGGLRLAQAEAMNRIETEFDNVAAAWRRAADADTALPDRVKLLTDAAPGLMHYCDHRGRWAEGLELFGQATAAHDDAGHTEAGAALQGWAAHLAHRLDRYQSSDAMARRALESASPGSPVHLQANKVLGANRLRLGHSDEALVCYRQALAAARAAGDRINAAAALSNLALIARNLDQQDEALTLTQQALAEHRVLGNVAAEALGLNNLALLHLNRHRFAAARAALADAAKLCQRHQLPATASLVENNLADLAWREGDMDAAALHGQRAIASSRQAGQRSVEILTRNVLTRVALHRGELAQAREHMSLAMRDALAIDNPTLKANGAYVFAELLAAQGEPRAAARVLRFAMQHPTISRHDRELADARIERWLAPGERLPPWPALTLDALVQRIVDEAAVGHGPLIAQLAAR